MNNVSRRTLAKGAAWAAPVVISTAAIPAYAASSSVCSSTEPTTNINWANFVRTTGVSANGSSSLSGSVSTTDGKATLTITHVSSTGPSLSNSQDMIAENLSPQYTVPWTTYSGLDNYLFFQTLQTGTNGYSGGNQKSTITLSFSTPVSGLSFTIGDVDQASSGSGGPWQDILAISASLNGVATTAPTASGGATITTSGSTTNIVATQTSLTPSATSGNVAISFTEPLDTVTIQWSNGSNRTGAQNIVIGGATPLSVCSTSGSSN